MPYELIAIVMFAGMMLMLMTGQRVFGAIGFVGAVAGMLRQGVGVGFMPAYWVRALNLRAVGARTPLAPLHYAFQWRRGDARALITAMQPLAQTQVDFSVSPAFAGAMSL